MAGIRKPNVKSRVKARTTGAAKRAAKRAVNPAYGKKGMGVINDPKKAAYNAAYSRTTVGVGTDDSGGSSAGCGIGCLAVVVLLIAGIASGFVGDTFAGLSALFSLFS